MGDRFNVKGNEDGTVTVNIIVKEKSVTCKTQNVLFCSNPHL